MELNEQHTHTHKCKAQKILLIIPLLLSILSEIKQKVKGDKRNVTRKCYLLASQGKQHPDHDQKCQQYPHHYQHR